MTGTKLWNWQKLPKKALLSLLMLASVPGMQGCTDEEFATGVAIVAIGAAGVAIGAAAAGRNRNRDRDYQPPRRERCWSETRCRSYRDYYGQVRQECSEERVCDGSGPRHGMQMLSSVADVNASLASLSTSGAVTVNGFADTFGMSHQAADELLDALEAARNKDASRLAALGIDQGEIKRLANYQMPSAQAIDSVARNINASSAAVSSMMQKLIQIAWEQNQAAQQNQGSGGN